MTIHEVEHAISSGLAQENQSHPPLNTAQFDSAYISLDAYVRPYAESIRGYELVRHVKPLGPVLRIVDVGAGSGQSSFFLMSLGHRVTVVEPSPVFCQQIAYASRKFGAPVDIYTVSAEEMNKLPVRDFDVVIFDSSLHHCDAPVKALQNARALLRAAGTVLVLHEPHLRFYDNRARYMQRMLANPVSAGHYGGNEHIYRYREYMQMLNDAGFQHIVSTPDIRNWEPRLALEDLLWRRVGSQPVYSAGRLWLRLTWLIVLSRALRLPVVGGGIQAALKRLSIVAVSYSGVAPA